MGDGWNSTAGDRFDAAVTLHDVGSFGVGQGLALGRVSPYDRLLAIAESTTPATATGQLPSPQTHREAPPQPAHPPSLGQLPPGRC